MHRSRLTSRVNRRKRGRKGESRERFCCSCMGSRFINDELFFLVLDHRSRIGDFCRSSGQFRNVFLLHHTIDSLCKMALCFAFLLWLLLAAALSATCSLSIVPLVVVVGTVACIFTALAPCVSGTRVHRAWSVVRNAEAGSSTGGAFTPGLGSLSLSLSLLSLVRSTSIIATMATAAPMARPLFLLLFISCILSSSLPQCRSALSCIAHIFNSSRQGFLLPEVNS